MNLKTWPRAHKICFALILTLFWISGFVRAVQIGNHANPATDGSSEGIILFSTAQYLEQGFFKNYLLPTYPAFGEDLSGNPRTEPFVYDHYLPGSDLTLGVWLKVFGENSLWAARLIPHTLSTIALALLALFVFLWTKESFLACIFLALMMVPRAFTAWSICLYGHSYATAIVLSYLAVLGSFILKKKSPKAIFGISMLAGFLTPFYALDWSFVLFFSGASLMLVLQTPRKTMIYALGGIICGGLTIGLAQVTLASFYHGSFANYVGIAKEWLLIRTHRDPQNNANFIARSFSYVLREFNKQAYGATGFTAYNLDALCVFFVFLAYWGRALNKKQVKTSLLALFFAHLGCIAWHSLFKNHAMGNSHFVLRHYLMLYVAVLLISVPALYSLVLRARNS